MNKTFDFAAKTRFSVDKGDLTPIYVVEQDKKRFFVSSVDGCHKEGEKYVFPSHCEYAVGKEIYHDTYSRTCSKGIRGRSLARLVLSLVHV